MDHQNENSKMNRNASPHSKTSILNRHVENLLNKCLLFEYKYVQKFCPLGVYILPEKNNLKIWNGIIFINEGVYEKGIFKFLIKIPNNYPSVYPKVFFLSNVLHPLVDGDTGELDITFKFKNWQSGKNLIINIIFFLKNIFYNPEYFQERNSFNPDISEMFSENYELFTEKIKESCEKSFNERFSSENEKLDEKFYKLNYTKSSIYSELMMNKIHQQVENTQTNIKNLSINEKVQNLKKWFLENYLEKLKEDK